MDACQHQAGDEPIGSGSFARLSSYRPGSAIYVRNATMADLESPREAKQRMRAAAKQDRAVVFARSGSAAAERLAEIGLAFTGAPGTAIVSAFSAIGDEINPFHC